MQMIRVLAAMTALVASTTAFSFTASPVTLGRSSAAVCRSSAFAAAPKVSFRRAPMALRMQSEDDKAKAAGIAAATVGLILSKFSLLFAVLAGGAAVYAGKLGDAHLMSKTRHRGTVGHRQRLCLRTHRCHCSTPLHRVKLERWPKEIGCWPSACIDLTQTSVDPDALVLHELTHPSLGGDAMS